MAAASDEGWQRLALDLGVGDGSSRVVLATPASGAPDASGQPRTSYAAVGMRLSRIDAYMLDPAFVPAAGPVPSIALPAPPGWPQQQQQDGGTTVIPGRITNIAIHPSYSLLFVSVSGKRDDKDYVGVVARGQLQRDLAEGKAEASVVQWLDPSALTPPPPPVAAPATGRPRGGRISSCSWCLFPGAGVGSNPDLVFLGSDARTLFTVRVGPSGTECDVAPATYTGDHSDEHLQAVLACPSGDSLYLLTNAKRMPDQDGYASDRGPVCIRCTVTATGMIGAGAAAGGAASGAEYTLTAQAASTLWWSTGPYSDHNTAIRWARTLAPGLVVARYLSMSPHKGQDLRLQGTLGASEGEYDALEAGLKPLVGPQHFRRMPLDHNLHNGSLCLHPGLGLRGSLVALLDGRHIGRAGAGRGGGAAEAAAAAGQGGGGAAGRDEDEEGPGPLALYIRQL